MKLILISLLAFTEQILNCDSRPENDAESPIKSFLSLLQKRSVQQKQVTATVNKNVTLKCSAYGYPLPNIHWLRNGEKIKQTVYAFEDFEDRELDVQKQYFGKVVSNLYLDCIQAKEEAVYTCVAENTHNRETFDTRLTVVSAVNTEMEGKSTMNNRPLCASGEYNSSPARIQFSTEVTFKLMGFNVHLHCGSIGIPEPIRSWSFQNGTHITNSHKYQILDNGDLVVKDLVWNDMGAYKCRVENKHGSDEVTAFIYPLSPE